MNKLSDSVLLEELKKRFNENKKALHDLRVMTKKLEQVNRKLQDSEALKSNFLSNIRNEIVNPLTSIMGLAEQIFSNHSSGNNASSMSKMIFSEAFKLNFQLKNIFLAAEIEAGESTISISFVDIDTLIKNLVSSFENNAKEKNLSIEYKVNIDGNNEAYSYFKTDPEKIDAILANLLSNAIEYSLENNKVLISIEREGTDLICQVKDWGIGISNDERTRIFDRFSQLDSGVRKSHHGHGLGLSIVKALIEILEGDLGFISVVGKGTTFTVRIPESMATEVTTFSEEGNEFIFDEEGDSETEEI